MLCSEFICEPRAVFRTDYHSKVMNENARLWRVHIPVRVCVFMCTLLPQFLGVHIVQKKKSNTLVLSIFIIIRAEE